MEILAALGLGFSFGWMLHKAGLTHYARIVGVYRLTDMTVMKFMLTALMVAAVLMQAALDLGITRPWPIPPTLVLANAVGGLVFGIGMATSGFCTGTVVAQAGEGRLDAIVAGLPGLVVGALVFGLLEPYVMPGLSRVGALGRATLPALAEVNPWLVLLVLGQLVAVVFYAAGKLSPVPSVPVVAVAAVPIAVTPVPVPVGGPVVTPVGDERAVHGRGR